jgi:hypothetical protein
VSENRVLREVYKCMGADMMRGFKKSHKEGLYSLYSSPDINYSM